jgi:hypothetical protein
MARVSGNPSLQRHPTYRLAAAGVARSALLAVPGGALATEVGSGGELDVRHQRCERTFEIAQRIDMEAFRDYELNTWRDVHHDEAVSIFADGTVLYSRDAILGALRRHFDDREAIWSWTELFRTVDGCKTAFILYDTVYEIPSIDFRQHAVTGVAYTHEHGRWLVVSDQSTRLP